MKEQCTCDTIEPLCFWMQVWLYALIFPILKNYKYLFASVKRCIHSPASELPFAFSPLTFLSDHSCLTESQSCPRMFPVSGWSPPAFDSDFRILIQHFRFDDVLQRNKRGRATCIHQDPHKGWLAFLLNPCSNVNFAFARNARLSHRVVTAPLSWRHCRYCWRSFVAHTLSRVVARRSSPRRAWNSG